MKGVEIGEVRDAIVAAFGPDEFDMFLLTRLEFNRADEVADGPFKKVVFNVVQQATQQGWDPTLIAAVAAERPLKRDVQTIYKKYAQGLIDAARQQAVEQSWLTALQKYGLAPGVDLQTAGASRLAKGTPATDGGFEKAVKQYLPYLDVGLWRERLFQLEARVCRVEVGNGEMGTGFLVGPDALLTNYHVLRGVLDGAAPSAAVRFRFDYKRLANGAEAEGVLAALHPTDWQIDFSPYSPAEAANQPDAVPPTADELDYALVRLERPIGNEKVNPNDASSSPRGWIAVPTTAPALTPKMPVLILQHPKAQPLQLALDTEGILKVSANGTRVRYATNTEAGSSGSPCFDLKWNLVALHHYGDPAYNHLPAYNQGIPIVRIRECLARRNKAAALGGAPP